MQPFALLIDNQFQYIRDLSEKPVDIPHKLVTWHDVVREYGEPFEGLENGVWVIRTVDPSTLPPPVPYSIAPRQCRLLLLQQGLLQQVEDMIAQQDEATRITWEYALEFRRDDPLLLQLAANMSPPLTEAQIDEFFIAASQL